MNNFDVPDPHDGDDGLTPAMEDQQRRERELDEAVEELREAQQELGEITEKIATLQALIESLQ